MSRREEINKTPKLEETQDKNRWGDQPFLSRRSLANLDVYDRLLRLVHRGPLVGRVHVDSVARFDRPLDFRISTRPRQTI